jgi:hypothetical protein
VDSAAIPISCDRQPHQERTRRGTSSVRYWWTSLTAFGRHRRLAVYTVRR